jgi:hypothetical protein
MKYDLDIVMPVCGRFIDRVEDFKKYGLINFKNRKVKLNLILSNEEIENIENGWPSELDLNLVKNETADYVQNTYKFFFNLQPEDIDARWIMKIDDDSCTDIDGLVANLDEFYDHEGMYYLAASCSRFEGCGVGGREGSAIREYFDAFENYKPIAYLLWHEIEACVISNTTIKYLLENERFKKFLKRRCEILGGTTDCGLNFASAMAKVYPIDCPFLTHFPSLENFSIFSDGIKNHIHMISRKPIGENFEPHERRAGCVYEILTKLVDKREHSELENHVKNRKFLWEDDHHVRIFDFKDNYTVRSKPDLHKFLWVDYEGSVRILDRDREIHNFRLNEDGNLTDGRITLIRL